MKNVKDPFLSDLIPLKEQFARSTRIDDKEKHAGNFVISNTIDEFLRTLTKHQSSENPQGAYTWTGPYGSGKSMLANCLLTFLTGSEVDRANLKLEFGASTFDVLTNAFFSRAKLWKSISVIGSKEPAASVLQTQLELAGIIPSQARMSDRQIIEVIQKFLFSTEVDNGLVLIIDEMGKFLEYAVNDDGDVYLYQLLAETASRSNGRFLFIGILHQSIQEYAATAIKRVKDEWSKVQGRFVDIGLNLNSSEQIELISNAIGSTLVPSFSMENNRSFGQYLNKIRRAPSADIETKLDKCWPLNPITTYVLGPVSKRSYGQNQRSLFSFIGSNEPLGFRAYLSNHTAKQVPNSGYNLADLWDYLMLNWNGIISASQDAHSFTIAKETVQQLSAKTPSEEIPIEVFADLIKSVHLLELTKPETGLTANIETLSIALGLDRKHVQSIIDALVKNKLLSLRSHNGSLFLHEGSTFDIDLSLSQELERNFEYDLSMIGEEFFDNQIIAKRHYLETGTLRWADIRLVNLQVDSKVIDEFSPNCSHFARFLVNLGGEPEKFGEYVNRSSGQRHFAYTTLDLSRREQETMREFSALLRISEKSPELSKDKIARREVNDRIDLRRNEISLMFTELVASASWDVPVLDCMLSEDSITQIVSKIADELFDGAPKIQNELVNRAKVSGNATRATKQLLYDLLTKEGTKDLGYVKFPPERAVFDAVIKSNGFYIQDGAVWRVREPAEKVNANAKKFKSLFAATLSYLNVRRERAVSLAEIFDDIWSKPPYGIKDGIRPIFAFLFIKIYQSHLVYYQDGIFSAELTEIDVDYMVKSPKYCSLRFLDISHQTARILDALAQVPSQLGGGVPPTNAPIDVARSLISLYDQIPPWTQKTTRISEEAKSIRAVFGRAIDPAQLTLIDIPKLFGNADVSNAHRIDEITDQLKAGLLEMLEFQPRMLSDFRDHLLREMGIKAATNEAIREINNRAQNLKRMAGDNRMETFISNLSTLTLEIDSIEKLAGMLVNKPAKLWIDNDVDRLFVEATSYARSFKTLETMGHILGRESNGQALTIIHHNTKDGKLLKSDIVLSAQELIEAVALSERISAILTESLNGFTPKQLIAALSLMLESED